MMLLGIHPAILRRSKGGVQGESQVQQLLSIISATQEAQTERIMV
jgi:hypothetical protein